MAIIIKTTEEIQNMREGGKILEQTLNETLKRAEPGISTYELDQFAENYIKKNGGIPSFKGYQGFPGTLCTCRNEVIVHGIPKKDDILEEGDLFTIDCGVTYKGMITDAARTKLIGKVTPEKEKLLKTAIKALSIAIDTAKPGTRLGEVSKNIQEVIEEAGFYIIKDLTGHGVGKKLHEDPLVTNYFDGNDGPTLKEGMTLAIEPIFSVSTGQMKTLTDQWTIVTADHSPAVQVENTILITKTGNEVLTGVVK
ncbi:type I methionyl aminopeptidase [Candidatus Peregrinibacteria bacterium]|jgi:methionyl aminopeptidase|nr:type I methionyl aminopeptidase [Candidatus Peregrinibacteria bacterium]MBT7736421.1 type I methionyl aminopeptidase [Candidatus Peregrinibacteria bacterium]